MDHQSFLDKLQAFGTNWAGVFTILFMFIIALEVSTRFRSGEVERGKFGRGQEFGRSSNQKRIGLSCFIVSIRD